MTAAKTIEMKVQKKIATKPPRAFDAWLDPTVPGTTWHAADKFVLDPKVDGLFFWRMKPTQTPHYGRFTHVERPLRLEHTWMSPNTSGFESTVTVTFEAQGDHTLMTIVHAGLPDTDRGRSHEKGWTYFLGLFAGEQHKA